MTVQLSTVLCYDMLGRAGVLGQIISLQPEVWCSFRRILLTLPII